MKSSERAILENHRVMGMLQNLQAQIEQGEHRGAAAVGG